MESPAHPEGPDRPAPLVIRVPPPERPPSTPLGKIALALFMVFAFGIGVMLLAASPRWEGILRAILLWVPACLLIPLLQRGNRRYDSDREAFIKSLEVPSTRVVTELSRRWKCLERPPTPDEVLQVVEHIGTRQLGALIVCLGALQVPGIRSSHFEPWIIPARRFMWAGSPVIWWWQRRVVRAAPGMLQIASRTRGGDRPAIRDYPMLPGTTVIIDKADRHSTVNRRLNITLIRGTHRDTIPLWRMRRPAEELERIWSALLSTAPTPPLSDEELVG